jgi:Serine dehydrogenase proteinase
VAKKSPEDEKRRKVLELSNAIAKQDDCDVVIFNFSLDAGFHDFFHRFLRKRKTRRKNLLLFLVTEGGVADCAYRIARWIQEAYGRPGGTITIVVAGWCKSAGTLICIAAHRLLIADAGELGPLDVQIAKADEIWERSSGLVVEAAFQKLQQESFKLFFNHLMDIKEQAGRITFKTAADIAAQMMIGQTSDIFAKIDPLTVGEDYRSNLIAEQYAIRLNLAANNLVRSSRVDALDMLLRGYPSHGFVIDREEASKLFVHVDTPAGKIAELAQILGRDVVLPRNSIRQESPKLEYLNAENTRNAKAKATAKGGGRRGPGKKAAAAGPKVVRGRIPVRPEQKDGKNDDEKAA